MGNSKFASMSHHDKRTASWLLAVIIGLHLLGWGVFLGVVVPGHYRGLGLGIGVLAYTLGLRHAFDADHLSAIDNTTRKFLQDRHGTEDSKRPLATGFFFSLGHSTVVVAIGAGIVIAERSVWGSLHGQHATLASVGGVIGTLVSASFLFLIALLNISILRGISRVMRAMRQGEFDETQLEAHLQRRGFMNRFFGRLTRSIHSEWQMYPVGVLFGLGFDTATEVALLATTAVLATSSLPWYAIMCLPILFTAGMTMMDTADTVLMVYAYNWAFFNPIRKIYYNLVITTLSIAICVVIGTIEVAELLASEFHVNSGPLAAASDVNINTAGFIIVGMFIVTWLGALAYWHFGHLEERYSAPVTSPSTKVSIEP
jgi:nickel/cobalt transporter (NiCoT) family protein